MNGDELPRNGPGPSAHSSRSCKMTMCDIDHYVTFLLVFHSNDVPWPRHSPALVENRGLYYCNALIDNDPGRVLPRWLMRVDLNDDTIGR